MNVNIKFLSKSKNSKPTQKIAYNFNSFSKSKNINTEINVIGETVSDAVLLIDKFLDDCSLAKLSTVRIIHGKGTGKLKNGIHTFLKTNPHVKSFRMGTFGEGEMGVTVVELGENYVVGITLQFQKNLKMLEFVKSLKENLK